MSEPVYPDEMRDAFPASTPAPATSAAGEWSVKAKGQFAFGLYDENGTELLEVSDYARKLIDDISSKRNASLAALREQLEQLQAWKDYAEGLGLRIGICKSSDCSEGRLAHDLAEGSELHRIFDEWSHSIGMAQQLATAQKEASEAQAALRQKDDALEEEGRWLVGLLDYVKGNGDRPPSLWGVEEYLTERCRRPNPALAIQPDSSALNAVIEAATAPLVEVAQALEEYCVGHPKDVREIPDEVWVPFTKTLSAAAQKHNLSPDSPSKHARGVSSPKESESASTGAPSGQTAGVASQKAGKP